MTIIEKWFESFLRSHGIDHFGPAEDPMLLAIGRERDGVLNEPPPEEIWWRIVPTLHVLEHLRATVGPIRITSGWRSVAYNKAVGGAENSMHMFFNAVDFDPVDQSWHVSEIEDLLVGFQGGAPEERFEGIINSSFVGIGIYKDADFNHLDTRGLVFGKRGARWSAPSTS